MRTSTADLVLHPVRLRIVQAFLGDRTLTTSELRGALADVPTATLYRQVAALADGDVLEVVDERRVRGAVERTYRLRAGAGSVDAEEAAGMTPDEHARSFLAFVAGLLADYDRYLARGDVDLGRDLVGYRQAAMWLTDDELVELLDELQQVFASRLANRPAPGRTRRLLSTVLVPTDPLPPGDGDEGTGT